MECGKPEQCRETAGLILQLRHMEIQDIIIPGIRAFREEFPEWIVIIRWATTTWKTKLSLELAEYFPIEIISADSRQVYTYMDIWTDKISKEWQSKIPHYGIDLVQPDQTFTAWQWKHYAEEKIIEIQKHENMPVIAGGTWLYIDMLYKNFAMPQVEPQIEYRKWLYERESEDNWSLYKELQAIDPAEAQKLHPNSLPYLVRALEIFHVTWKTKTELAVENPVKRPIYMIWLRREKEDTNRRINKRIGEMMKWGLIEEVQRLLENWYGPQAVAMQGIGYKEIVWYLQKEYDLERAIELLKRNTHYLAKKQRTRFRKYILDAKVNPKQQVQYQVIYLDNS